MDQRLISVWLASASLAASAALAADVPGPLAARGQTEPTSSLEIGAGVVVRDPANPSGHRIVAAAGLGGLEVYDIQGKRLGSTPAGEVVSVDVSDAVALGGRSATVVAAVDSAGHRLRLYTMWASALTEVSARRIDLGFAAEGVCLYKNPLDGALHAFVVGDGGEIDHQLIYPGADGTLDARQVRRISVPSPLKQCVVSSDGQLYASEETVGIWRFNADPEAYAEPVLVDTPLLGKLDEEVGGLALHDGGEGVRWLIAALPSAGRLNVYDRTRNDRYLGSFAIAAPGATEAIDEPGPLFVTGAALGEGYPTGALLVADEDAANLKLVAIADLAKSLGIDAGTPSPEKAARPVAMPAVTATIETVPVGSFGDAADDPAIWADPVDPAKSLIIATDKQAGLYVHDMQGRVVQFLPDGKMNNVDLRADVDFGDGKKSVVVTASNRTHKSIGIYRLDTEKRELIDIADGIQPTGLNDPYGLCMYRSAEDGRAYVFINGDDTRKRQWQLVDAGNGRVRANHVRDMRFDSQTEGCVVDDAAAALYVNEEDTGLWRLSARPDGTDDKAMIERIADNARVKDDFEGVGLYRLGDGRGYIVVSSQGNDSYAVYRLEGRHEYLGSFAVVADPVLGIDGISETDGLEVTSQHLGPGFEHGAMIAQDGRNVMPVQNQNYKYVPWTSIARALDLEVRDND